ncbi:hypothetical protein Scep_016808 [Stephania cephalantha]|uniref:Uncharacterized protein n=1 Tax=Stephania cephalantha TaxID=152367 RepID=A0AAP0INX2_9MAGN
MFFSPHPHELDLKLKHQWEATVTDSHTRPSTNLMLANVYENNSGLYLGGDLGI